MHLEKLQMRGFKTFADKTELEFGPGITVIVGPNGVGKSNIADAVLWVLGEQGTVPLRVESAEGVVFAGSEDRRPLGMAEVSLTLDNSDGTLDSEYSEIEIGRRLFRTGKSEYLINRDKVRLADVRDLLVDSGLGTDSYALVGQGEIDAILSAHPEDRRELIEEVAGVRKYRIRRSRAERKLAETQDNLIRVRDIIHELHTQREPLEQQAKVARRYKQLSGRLHELQLGLLAADYNQRRQQRGAILNDIAVVKADLQTTRNELSTLEAEYEKNAGQVDKLADRLEELRSQQREAQRELDRQRNAQAVASEKLRGISEQRQHLERQREQAQQRCQQLQTEIRKLEESQAGQQHQLADEQGKLADMKKAVAKQEEEHRAILARREQVRQHHTELSGQLAEVENEVAALQGLRGELDERIQRLVDQQRQFERQRSELQDSIEQLRRQQATRAEHKEELAGQLREARQQHVALIDTLREHRRKRDRLGEAVAAAESRQALLEELQRDHEGYAEGPRALLEAARNGEISGVQGVVADFLDVPRRLEVAVEAGLGPRLQWVLVSSEEDLQRCVEYLQANNLGRATVIAVNAPVPSFAARMTAGVGRTTRGVHGTLDSLLNYPRKLSRVLDYLLGDVLVIDDLEVATRLRPMLTGPVKMVTLNGDVVGPAGEISAGSLAGDVQRSLDRRREVAALDEHLQELRSYLAQMWETEEKLERQGQQLGERVKTLERQFGEFDKQATAIEGDLRHAGDRFRAAQAAYQEITAEISALEERRQQADSRCSEAEGQRLALTHQLEGNEQELSGLPAVDTAEHSLEDQREQLIAARVRVAELEEKVRSSVAMVEQHKQELNRVEQEIANYNRQLAELDQAEAQARATHQSDESEDHELEQRVRQLGEQVESCQRDLIALRGTTSEVEATRRKLLDLREEQSEQLHRLELRQAREDSELEHIIGELEEVYELTPKQAAQQQPEDFDLKSARTEAAKLKREIRELGYVNVSAIEECERLQDRENYLSSQLEDLRQARDDLESVIAEIDETAKATFLASFEQVAEAFDDLFKWLFGGGSTRLEMTDPENPLDGGVEVIVQQPGRRFQNLMALSGGEKAMTGLALLFAMIRVKPTPFCFLDEIDASLDAANSRRFAEMLQDFAKNSQFVIITHNPETMEIADRLHGVTMEQPGISRLISVKLSEAQREAERWAEAEATVAASSEADRQSAPAG